MRKSATRLHHSTAPRRAGSGLRKCDFDQQARFGIACRDAAAVQFHGAAGDGEPQAYAAAGTAAVALHPVERVEDAGQRLRRHARAVIAHAHPHQAMGRRTRASTSTLVPSGAYRMALRITFSTARRNSSGSPSTVHGSAGLEDDCAAAGRASKAPSSARAASSRSSRTRSARRAAGSPSARVTCRSCAHQLVQAVGFFLNTVERGAAVLAGARQFNRHSQARQRGAQLVGDIAQQAPLGRQQGLDAVRHAVERCGQVAPARRARRRVHARGQVAVAEALHGALHLPHRGGHDGKPASSRATPRRPSPTSAPGEETTYPGAAAAGSRRISR